MRLLGSRLHRRVGKNYFSGSMEAIAAVLKTVFGWPARYYLVLGTASAALLWLSASRWANTLGLSNLPIPVRIGLTMFAVACGALWAAKTSYVVQCWMSRPLRWRRVRRHIRELSPDEQTILLWYFVRGNRTVHVDYTNQVAHGLRAKGILEYVGGTGHALATPHLISGVAWDALEMREAASPLSAADRAYLMGLSERDLYQLASPMRRQLGFG
jgi:hypothetical protein